MNFGDFGVNYLGLWWIIELLRMGDPSKIDGSSGKSDTMTTEVISSLSYPTNVKALRSFLGHVCF